MSNLQKLIRRGVKRLSAVALIILGVVTFPLPLPVGALLVAIGLALLISTNKTLARWVKVKRITIPSLNYRFAWMEKKLPRFFSKAIRKTAPDYGRKKNKTEDSLPLKTTTDASESQK